jgi:hypothetical protein
MCFNIHKNCPEAKTAKKNIKVYKILKYSFCNNIFKSPWYNKKYEVLKIYNARMALKPRDKFLCYGFHAYTSLQRAKKDIKNEILKFIMEFIIPKGAKYYINPKQKEIISNQIYWSGKIYSKDRWKIATERVVNNLFK